MTRPIKFRAWHLGEKRWLDRVTATINAGEPALINTGSVWDDFHQHHLEAHGADLSGLITLQQFTGLHDDGGKEIYEGDVVTLHPVLDYPWQVIYCTDETRGEFFSHPAGFYGRRFNSEISRMQHTPLWGSSVKIIGNIYENPELIEKGN